MVFGGVLTASVLSQTRCGQQLLEYWSSFFMEPSEKGGMVCSTTHVALLDRPAPHLLFFRRLLLFSASNQKWLPTCRVGIGGSVSWVMDMARANLIIQPVAVC
jgi:hypothetical protein